MLLLFSLNPAKLKIFFLRGTDLRKFDRHKYHSNTYFETEGIPTKHHLCNLPKPQPLQSFIPGFDNSGSRYANFNLGIQLSRMPSYQWLKQGASHRKPLWDVCYVFLFEVLLFPPLQNNNLESMPAARAGRACELCRGPTHTFPRK